MGYPMFTLERIIDTAESCETRDLIHTAIGEFVSSRLSFRAML
jgi:hypothetical protein